MSSNKEEWNQGQVRTGFGLFLLGAAMAAALVWLLSGTETGGVELEPAGTGTGTGGFSEVCQGVQGSCNGCDELMDYPIVPWGPPEKRLVLFRLPIGFCTIDSSVVEINHPLQISAPKSEFFVEAEGALVIDPPGTSEVPAQLSLSPHRLCALPWSNSNIAHWTFDNIVQLAACYRTNATTLVLTWNTKMHPWHFELLSHAFKGQIMQLAPSDDFVMDVPQGVFVPCLGGANDNPHRWMWRTSKNSCKHDQNQAHSAHIWVVLDQMQASLQTQAVALAANVSAAGELLFSKRTDSASGRSIINLPLKVETLRAAGYTEWNPLSYSSFAARTASLRETQRLVLETGSDMIQTLFMTPGSTVVVLANPILYVKVAFAKGVAVGLGLKFITCTDAIKLEWGHSEAVRIQKGRTITYIDPSTKEEKTETLSHNTEKGVRFLVSVDGVTITPEIVEELATPLRAMNDETQWDRPSYFYEPFNDLGLNLVAYTVSYSFDLNKLQHCLEP